MPFICVQLQPQMSRLRRGMDPQELHTFIIRSRRGCGGRGIAPTRDGRERPTATPSHQPMSTSSRGLGALGVLSWPTEPKTSVLDILPLCWAVPIRSTSEDGEDRRQTLSGLLARRSLLSPAPTRRRSEIVKLFRAYLAGKRALPRPLNNEVRCLQLLDGCVGHPFRAVLLAVHRLGVSGQ